MSFEWTKYPNRPAFYRAQREERKRALEDIGRYVQAKAAKYPPKPERSSYNRTGTLGRSITVGPVKQAGTSYSYVDVGTNKHYARYVEYGTGIYTETSIGVPAPDRKPIRPKTAKALAWRSTGGQVGPGGVRIASGVRYKKGKTQPNRALDVYMNFAASVRGMKPWHYMEKAFKDPATDAYFKARVEQMLRAIIARMELQP